MNLTSLQKLYTCLLILLSLQPVQAAPSKLEPQIIYWPDLIPKFSSKAIKHLKESLIEIPSLPNFGNVDPSDAGNWLENKNLQTMKTVSILEGEYIKITGYISTYSKQKRTKDRNFILVPEFGAGLFLPLPAPNQIIFLSIDKETVIENLTPRTFEKPVAVTGTLHTHPTLNQHIGYKLTTDKITLPIAAKH